MIEAFCRKYDLARSVIAAAEQKIIAPQLLADFLTYIKSIRDQIWLENHP